MKHASLGGSKAGRWMNCPASVRLEEQMPREPSSTYAMEGTAAHELAEKCLRSGDDAQDHLGEQILVDDRRGSTAAFTVDQEMAAAVQMYLDTIREDIVTMNGSAIDIEQAFDLGWLSCYASVTRKMFGTNDCCVYQAFGKLIVYDYKHGAGTRVEVEENPQAMYYALGRMGEHNEECFDTVELVIVQPRCPHPDGAVRRWAMPAEELVEWSRVSLAPAAAAACRPDAEAVPGEWCHFCRAQSICPALVQAVAAACPFDIVPAEKPISPPPVQSLTVEQRSKILGAADMMRKWLDGLREYEIEQQHNGTGCPDWKLVTKLGNRAWKDEDVLTVAKALGTKHTVLLSPPKMLSPAQAEKALKTLGWKAKETTEAVNRLCQRPEGVALVSAADPRPALEMKNPFTEVK